MSWVEAGAIVLGIVLVVVAFMLVSDKKWHGSRKDEDER